MGSSVGSGEASSPEPPIADSVGPGQGDLSVDGLVRLAALVLACGFAGLLSTSCETGPGQSEAAAAPTPPPGADESLNPGIFIQGGVVVRGSDHPGRSDNPASPFYTGDERPARRVEVGSFWIQEHEVTNREFRRFDPAHEFPRGRARHPVVDVTWREAMAYATSIGGRLPTEAEWELAAEGIENRAYPWGEAGATCERAHYADCPPEGTVPVLSFPQGATPEGVQDLAGNVWEWVMPGWFQPGLTPVNDEALRMRGGSYAEGSFFLRPSNRSNGFIPGFRSGGVGFRVAWPRD